MIVELKGHFEMVIEEAFGSKQTELTEIYILLQEAAKK